MAASIAVTMRQVSCLTGSVRHQPGLRLALWPRASIAHDSGLPVPPASAACATDLTIGHNVASKEAVDAVLAQAARAGARIVKPAQATFWGSGVASARTTMGLRHLGP